MSHGIMCMADMMSHDALILFAKTAEQSGIETIWIPELVGRDPFITAAVLLGATTTIRVGSAIANVYVRDARATKSAAYCLADAYSDRFDLGLGLSNPVGNVPRGHEWLPPLKKMTDFMDRFDAADLMFKHNTQPIPRYLAAHGPRLMDFAAARLEGAYTYLQTLEYSAAAKNKLGDKRLLLMQPTVFNVEPEAARKAARRAIAVYMPLKNYHRAWRERGFMDEDFASGGSDDFIDALIAWGDQDKIVSRYTEQRERGVDHIIIIPVGVDLKTAQGWQQVERLIAA
jgi:probable F420-dependent oxidoreductase